MSAEPPRSTSNLDRSDRVSPNRAPIAAKVASASRCMARARFHQTVRPCIRSADPLLSLVACRYRAGAPHTR